jgi:hypothetical protein
MGTLNRPLMFVLADALGMPLSVDPDTNAINGETTRDVNLGGLRLTVPIRVVSSAVGDSYHMAIVKVFGNLSMLVYSRRVANADVVYLHLLNIAKIDKMSGYLEKLGAFGPLDVLEKLKPGIVASFYKNTPTVWMKLEEAKA